MSAGELSVTTDLCFAAARGMATLRFGPEDLLRIRFGLSRVTETLLAVRAGSVARSPELDPLRILSPARGYTPAFLTPLRHGLHDSFDAELDRVRSTPAHVASRQIAHSLEGRQLAAPMRAVVQAPNVATRLAGALQQAWGCSVATRWTELREVLEADIAYRARRFAKDGLAGLFDDLSPRVALVEDQLRVYGGATCRIDLGGRGLLLVPSAFVEPTVMTRLEAPWGPALVYPSRGTAALEDPRAPVDEAARRLIGQTRATILAAIATPASTTAVARRLGLSAGGVSDHLKVLRDAGLAIRSRFGPEVQYRQTDLARELLQGRSD
jgi:DNA-binding transcriptional ArsR family regulator